MTHIDIALPFEIHATLERLAHEQSRSISEVLADAVARYEESLFWEAARAGYEKLNADPAARATFDAELALWDTTLNDGLAEFPFDEDAHQAGEA